MHGVIIVALALLAVVVVVIGRPIHVEAMAPGHFYKGQNTQYVLKSGNILTRNSDQTLVLKNGKPDMTFLEAPANIFPGTRVNGYASIGGKWAKATASAAKAARGRQKVRR